MPWTAADASKKTHKADTPHRQRMWSDVANKVLSETKDEQRAIRSANAAVERDFIKSKQQQRGKS